MLRVAGIGLAAMRQLKRLGCVLLIAAILWTAIYSNVAAEADVLPARSLKQFGESPSPNNHAHHVPRAHAADRTWQGVYARSSDAPLLLMYNLTLLFSDCLHKILRTSTVITWTSHFQLTSRELAWQHEIDEKEN